MSGRRQRPPLSKERVLRAAVALVDARGLEALSMRKLARELGVEAMSLYNHVADKDEILDGMVELVAAEVDLAEDAVDWKDGLRRRVLSAHELFGRHPWAARLWMSSRTFGVERVRIADAVLRDLREGGFPPALTYHGFHVLQSYLLGYSLYAQNLGFQAQELEQLATEFLRDFPVAAYPDLAAHIRQHLEPHAAHEGTFAFGLDLVLDALERLRDAG